MITTLGKEMVRDALPDKYKAFADQTWDDKTSKKVLTKMALEDPDLYEDTLQRLNDVGRHAVALYGNEASLRFKDLAPGAPVRKLQKTMRDAMRAIYNSDLPEDEKKKKVVELGSKYYGKILDVVKADMRERGSAFNSQMQSGARGKPIQATQMLFGNIMVQDARGRDIPYLGLTPYAAGVHPLDLWVGGIASRAGYQQIQFATADSGYLSKQISNAVHDMPVSMVDCGTTDTGIAVDAADSDNLGSILLRPYKKFPAGTVVNQDVLDAAEDGDELIVRSPLTCKAKEGVCAHCSGLDENQKFPAVGSYVALNASKAFTEPLTQSQIGKKHAAEATLKNQVDETPEDAIEGFAAVEQMLSAPESFKGAAVVTKLSGSVTDVKSMPQGGYQVYIDGKSAEYVPANRRLKVSKGDQVEAGDVLTNGIPNPADIVEHKGIGPGRMYMLRQFGKELKDAGAGTNRRNVEQFVRAMVNKVKITDPDGYRGYLPGDEVNYNTVAGLWKPEDTDSVVAKPSSAVGQYLYAPVFSYNIGTPITKKVADDLEKHGFTDVTVSAKKPPFEPVFVRAADVLRSSPEWLPRMSGEHLKDTLFDAARRNSETAFDSNSMYSKIVMSPYNKQDGI